MACEDCGSEEGSFGRPCPACVERRKKNHQLKLEQWKQKYEEPGGFDLLYFIKSNITIILIVLAAGYLFAAQNGVFGYGTVPPLLLESASNSTHDPCLQKKRCVIAYLAPWCPSCKGSVGFLNALQKTLAKSENVALKIVLGMDQEGNLQDFASKFSADVFFDVNGELASSVGIRSIPSVFMVDDKRSIVKKGLPGALHGGSDEESVNYYIDNYLKVREFL